MKDNDQFNDANLNLPTETEKIKPRAVYSMDEIEKILVGIDSVLSEHKAKSEGIDPKDMVKTIRGGRIVWITKKEMNAMLSKKRKLSAKKYAKKSGLADDAASSEINQRVFACKSIISAIRKIASEETKLLLKQYRKIEYFQNLSITRSRDIRILDAAIQRKKQEDPILKESEEINRNLVDAIRKQDSSEIEVCQNFKERHIEEILYKQQRLEPYIQKVETYRNEFLIAKRQLLQRQFKLIEECFWIIEPRLDDLIYHDKEGESAEKIVGSFKEIDQTIVKVRQSGIEILDDNLDKPLSIDVLSQLERKQLGPLIDRSVQFVSMLFKAWLLHVEKMEPKSSICTKSSSQTKPGSSRMAYATKNDAYSSAADNKEEKP